MKELGKFDHHLPLNPNYQLNSNPFTMYMPNTLLAQGPSRNSTKVFENQLVPRAAPGT